MKLNFTIRCKRDRTTNRIFIDEQELKPAHSLRLRNHSPDGFNWGYGGSGAAQAALAILLHVTENEDVALTLYQSFKFKFVGGWNEDEFEKKVDITDFILDHYPSIAPYLNLSSHE